MLHCFGMKTFYFVRHGESESNVSRVLVGSSTPLTKKGVEQSTFLAKRFETIPIELVVASPWKRTKQTAEIFNTELKKPIEYSDLLVEQRYPAEIYGLHIDDPELKRIMRLWYENTHTRGWHHSDEESAYDLRQRAERALMYLLSLPYDKIAVISHGRFLRTLLASIMHGEKLEAHMLVSILQTLHTSNTGITLATHDGNRWALWTWNDHAHLGEVVHPHGKLSY